MTTIEHTPDTSAAGPRDLFARVLVGVDASPESLEAARQAALLAEDDGTLSLVAAWTVPPPVVGVTSGFAYPLDDDPRRQAAHAAVEQAETKIAAIHSAHTKVVRGVSWGALLVEIDAERPTLIAVGSHGTGRMHGILIGSTATEIVHKAPCSVLVARQAGATFPRRIVVGVDGSPESAAAYVVAARLAKRFDAELWPVVAHGGKGVAKPVVATIVDYRHEDLPDEPVRALVAASTEADLVVVGSRGLHGIRSLGSVSERVAHEAHCSTLIVR